MKATFPVGILRGYELHPRIVVSSRQSVAFFDCSKEELDAVLSDPFHKKFVPFRVAYLAIEHFGISRSELLCQVEFSELFAQTSYTEHEVSAVLGCSLRTIQRRIAGYASPKTGANIEKLVLSWLTFHAPSLIFTDMLR